MFYHIKCVFFFHKYGRVSYYEATIMHDLFKILTFHTKFDITLTFATILNNKNVIHNLDKDVDE